MEIAINGICGEGLFFSYQLEQMIFVIATLFTGILHMLCFQKKKRTILTTAGVLIASIGVYGAKDFFTLYVCFEIAGFVSCIWLAGHEKAQKRYLAWVTITGMIMTMGMFLVSHYAGTLEFDQLEAMTFRNTGWLYAAAGCYMVGFATRCGAAFFHSWTKNVFQNLSYSIGALIGVLLMPTGVWGIYKLGNAMLFAHGQWAAIMALFGMLTMLLGFVKCFLDSGENKVISYFAMSQMGWLLIFTSLGAERWIWIEMLLFLPAQQLMMLYQREKKGMYAGLTILLVCAQLGIGVWFLHTKEIFIGAVFMAVLMVRSIRLVEGKDHWETKIDTEWCSLEYMIYAPLFGKVFPFVFGVIFRALDQLPDAFVALMRRTAYQDSKQRVWDKVGTHFTYMAGVLIDDIVLILNRTILRRRPIRHSFVNAIAVAKKEWEATTALVTQSVSFGLLLFCIGLCVTLIYLMY